MIVKEISVCRLPDNVHDGQIRAVVTIHTDRRRTITLFCRATPRDPKADRAALIADALRQLSRMPEHRQLRPAG